jgi:hypothetical protein
MYRAASIKTLDKKGQLALDLKKGVLNVQLRIRVLLEKMFVSCCI